nr:MAG TPA: hypothetical protein [Caudoviricetes sp.]
MNDGYIRRSDLMAALNACAQMEECDNAAVLAEVLSSLASDPKAVRVPEALRTAVEKLIGVYEAQQARIAALQDRWEEQIPFLGQF